MEKRQAKPISEVSCHRCGGMARWFISSADVNRGLSEEVFSYYQCSACQLIFLSPLPPDLHRFYQGGYQRIPRTLAHLRTIAAKEKYRLEPVLKNITSGKLLEIGPWMGIFSCNAKDAGFDVTAIEMDSDCVDFLRNIVGVNAVLSADPSSCMDQMTEQFDVIVMWHSLEHLPRPWDVLRSASQRLAHGGILVVAIPNIQSYDFHTLGARWLHLDAPRHLYFYTAEALERTCLDFGLSKIEISTRDRLSVILSRNAWGEIARHRLPIRIVRRLLALTLHSIALKRSNGNGSGLTGVFLKP